MGSNEKDKSGKGKGRRKWSAIAIYGFLATTKLASVAPETFARLHSEISGVEPAGISIEALNPRGAEPDADRSRRFIAYEDYLDGYQDSWNDPDYTREQDDSYYQSFYSDYQDYSDYSDYYDYYDYSDYSDYSDYYDYYDYSDYADTYSDGTEGAPG